MSYYNESIQSLPGLERLSCTQTSCMQCSQSFKLACLTSLVAHIFVATVNGGPIHPDEFFQTFQFAFHRLGIGGPASIPWEFTAGARSWLLPGIIALIAKLIGSNDRGSLFLIVDTTRYLLAVLGWGALVSFAATFRHLFLTRWLRIGFDWAILLFPLSLHAHARTSGENLSGSCLLVGLTLLEQLRKSHEDLSIDPRGVWTHFFFVGLVSGLMFSFRYQTIVVLPIILTYPLWWAWRARNPLGISALLAGFALSIASEMMLNEWGYRKWSFPPWTYFHENVLLGKAATFGISPWYTYATDFLSLDNFYAMSLILALAGIGAAFSWQLAPAQTFAAFVFMHCLIGHKELRFMFPVIPLIPLLGCLSVQKLARYCLRIAHIVSPRLWEAPAAMAATLLLLSCWPVALRGGHEFFNVAHVLSVEAKPHETLVIESPACGNPYDVWNWRMTALMPPQLHVASLNGNAPDWEPQGKAFWRLTPNRTVAVQSIVRPGERNLLCMPMFSKLEQNLNLIKLQTCQLQRCSVVASIPHG